MASIGFGPAAPCGAAAGATDLDTPMEGPFDWTPLIEHLRERSPFLFFHNPGNAGDALIYLGFRRLAERHGIEYAEYSRAAYEGGNRRIVFGGGGNFVEHYDDCRNCILRHIDDLESFTLLPHTIAANEDVLTRLDRRFHLFCREPVSFEHCRRQVAGRAELTLLHDLALALDPGEVRRLRLPLFFPRLSLKRQARWLRSRRSLRGKVASADGSFFRTDLESAGGPAGPGNFDVSLGLPFGHRKPVQREGIAKAFVGLIAGAPSIRTDRLHVGIAGALLGKPTKLYPNSYYKNEAICRHSLAGAFPNVCFAG